MKASLLPVLLLSQFSVVLAQSSGLSNGMVCQTGSSQRLANIKVLNKKNRAQAITNDIGEFKIAATAGDTLEFSNELFEKKDVVVDATQVTIAFLNKFVTIKEVVINENSLKKDLIETQRVYHSKGVFYTGPPHYYYLVLKPMTFIYENFKSEVINARKFKKVAKSELEGQEISKRFNEKVVQKYLPLNDGQAEAFVIKYWPTIQQVRTWNDYDIAQYIRRSYADSVQRDN